MFRVHIRTSVLTDAVGSYLRPRTKIAAAGTLMRRAGRTKNGSRLRVAGVLDGPSTLTPPAARPSLRAEAPDPRGKGEMRSLYPVTPVQMAGKIARFRLTGFSDRFFRPVFPRESDAVEPSRCLAAFTRPVPKLGCRKTKGRRLGARTQGDGFCYAPPRFRVPIQHSSGAREIWVRRAFTYSIDFWVSG